MVLEDNELDSKVFEDLTVQQIVLFKKLLEENNITYEVMHVPCDRINGITYEVSLHIYNNYAEFITELNTKNVAEIYLYKVYVDLDKNTGSMVYKIRYAINRDLIANKTIKDIKKLFGFIKSNKNVQGISADKIKRILQKLSELESKIKDEKLKERTRELRYIKLCEDINDILQYDGYNGDYEDVIEYFDRAGFKFRISNRYFDIHPKLKGLYTLLQKCNKTNDLQQLQKEYNYIVQKMKAFSHITEEVLINSILLAFQELVPPGFNIHKPNILSNAFISEPVFHHTIEVQQQFVDCLLVDWYKNNINDYLLTPMMNLKEHERTRLFKIY